MQTVVIVHSGGNDFIGAELGYNPFKTGNNWVPRILWRFPKALRATLHNLAQFLDCLVAEGFSRFLVCDIPATPTLPVMQLARLASIRSKCCVGIKGLDRMLADFRERHSSAGVQIARVPEV